MIRKASIEDIPLIRSMAEIAFRETYKTILSRDQIEYMMDFMYSDKSLFQQMSVDDHIFFIDDNKGYASFRHQFLEDDGTEVFHLEKLYVLPDFQKSGLGKALFNTVVSEAKYLSSGHHLRIELNVNRNNPALGFYKHIGMKEVSRGDFPIGKGFYMNDYIMVIDI